MESHRGPAQRRALLSEPEPEVFDRTQEHPHPTFPISLEPDTPCRQPDPKDTAELARAWQARTAVSTSRAVISLYQQKGGIFIALAGLPLAGFTGWQRGLPKEGKIILVPLPFKLPLWNKSPVTSFVWQNRRIQVKINLKHHAGLQSSYAHFVLLCRWRTLS